jgi:hypothetical protein
MLQADMAINQWLNMMIFKKIIFLCLRKPAVAHAKLFRIDLIDAMFQK